MLVQALQVYVSRRAHSWAPTGKQSLPVGALAWVGAVRSWLHDSTAIPHREFNLGAQRILKDL